MFRYRITFPDGLSTIRYGVPQAEGVTANLESRVAYFISDISIFRCSVPTLDDSVLSKDQDESPIVSIMAEFVYSFKYPIQCIGSVSLENSQYGYLYAIDERGNIIVFKSDLRGSLSLYLEFKHKDTTPHQFEESWSLLRVSPSGKYLLSLHGLSSSLNIFSLDDPSFVKIIPVAGHPRSACWRDDTTVVVSENKQLSQLSIIGEHTMVPFNRVNVSNNMISCICCVPTSGNIVACTYSDRGVYGLSSSCLKIVKRWRAPIRNHVVSMVPETIDFAASHATIEAIYMCGDDNEVLMYNNNGKEGINCTLQDRHSINIRSRSRVIGLCLRKEDNQSLLFILGQNGDLDIVKNPWNYLMEKRKRKRNEEADLELKRIELDE